MPNTDHPLVQEVLSLIQMMDESCAELILLLDKQEIETFQNCQILFNDLAAAVSGLLSCTEPLKEHIGHAFFEEMVENIDEVLCDAVERINEEQISEAVKVLHYQLFPFIKELWEEIYFWGSVYPNKKRMAHYYKEEFASHHSNLYITQSRKSGSTPRYKYKVSIFIPVFNKLDYTKQCINSIIKNTDFNKYSCEFILLNDGSTDGTQEYLENLDLGVDKKVIYLKRNVKTMIFSLAFRICEGEYFLFVNNDTLVTAGWLDNLLTCIESDPNFISATPCTPNTSNYQSDLTSLYPFHSPAKVLDHINQSNPSLWEERARIMPVIALYRTELVNRIGFADRYFFTMEFWDDDFSLRVRRAGYRQILCRDTYCYHFGSVTGKDSQVKENTLEVGRRLFIEKNEVDAWGRDFCYDYQTVLYVKSSLIPDSAVCKEVVKNHKNGALAILGIDCGFGDTLLQMKNYLKSKRKTVSVYTISTETVYEADLKNISEQHIFTKDILTALDDFSDNSLDYVYIQLPLEQYEHYNELIRLIHLKLKNGGLLLFTAGNIYYKPFLESLLHLSFPTGSSEIVKFINIASLQARLNNIFSNIECLGKTETITNVEEFKKHLLIHSASPSTTTLLTARELKFRCIK